MDFINNMSPNQSVAKTYAHLIKFGRILESHQRVSQMTEDQAISILSMVNSIDQQLMWTKVEDFFSIFPPIKRYADDGTWDYNSTTEMIKERLGTHFGKDDFKHLIMSHCYENKYVQLVGFAFMISISRIRKIQTGRDLLIDFLESQ